MNMNKTLIASAVACLLMSGSASAHILMDSSYNGFSSDAATAAEQTAELAAFGAAIGYNSGSAQATADAMKTIDGRLTNQGVSYSVIMADFNNAFVNGHAPSVVNGKIIPWSAPSTNTTPTTPKLSDKVASQPSSSTTVTQADVDQAQNDALSDHAKFIKQNIDDIALNKGNIVTIAGKVDILAGSIGDETTRATKAEGDNKALINTNTGNIATDHQGIVAANTINTQQQGKLTKLDNDNNHTARHVSDLQRVTGELKAQIDNLQNNFTHVTPVDGHLATDANHTKVDGYTSPKATTDTANSPSWLAKQAQGQQQQPAVESKVAHTQVSVDTTSLNQGITDNHSDIERNSKQIVTLESNQSADHAQIDVNKKAIAKNGSDLAQVKQDVTDTKQSADDAYQQANTAQSKADDAYSLASGNTATITDTQADVATLQQHESTTLDAISNGDAETLSKANSYTDNRFKQLNDQVKKAERKADAGSASALAAVGIPGLNDGQTWNVGAGVGQFGEGQAVAVGANYRVSQNVALKIGATATPTTQDYGAFAGVSIGN